MKDMASNRYYDRGRELSTPDPTNQEWSFVGYVTDMDGVEANILYTRRELSNTASETVIEAGKATAEFIRQRGLALTQNRMEYIVREHEDFAEYVDDPEEHPIRWTYDVETYTGRRWTDWTPDLGFTSDIMYIYFMAHYVPTGADQLFGNGVNDDTAVLQGYLRDERGIPG